jgi:hypothetical protein
VLRANWHLHRQLDATRGALAARAAESDAWRAQAAERDAWRERALAAEAGLRSARELLATRRARAGIAFGRAADRLRGRG